MLYMLAAVTWMWWGAVLVVRERSRWMTGVAIMSALIMLLLYDYRAHTNGFRFRNSFSAPYSYLITEI
jgi:hypothetical protein